MTLSISGFSGVADEHNHSPLVQRQPLPVAESAPPGVVASLITQPPLTECFSTSRHTPPFLDNPAITRDAYVWQPRWQSWHRSGPKSSRPS